MKKALVMCMLVSSSLVGFAQSADQIPAYNAGLQLPASETLVPMSDEQLGEAQGQFYYLVPYAAAAAAYAWPALVIASRTNPQYLPASYDRVRRFFRR